MGGKRWSKPRPKNNQIKQIQKNGLHINDLNFNNFCGFSKFRLATWPLMFDIWLPISRHFICYIRFVWVDLIRFCSSQTSVVCLLLCFFFVVVLFIGKRNIETKNYMYKISISIYVFSLSVPLVYGITVNRLTLLIKRMNKKATNAWHLHIEWYANQTLKHWPTSPPTTQNTPTTITNANRKQSGTQIFRYAESELLSF